MSRILIVESNDAHAEFLSYICRSAGHEHLLMSEPRDLVERVRQEQIDLVILEILRPRFEGLEAAKAIRQSPELSRMPLLGVTASVEQIPTALSAGINLVLPKPFRSAEIKGALASLLRDEGGR